MSKVFLDLPFKLLLFFERKRALAKKLLTATLTGEVCVSHVHSRCPCGAPLKFGPPGPIPFPLGDVPLRWQSCCRAASPLPWCWGCFTTICCIGGDPPSPVLLPEHIPHIAVFNLCLKSLRNGVPRTINYICKHKWRRFHTSGEQGRIHCSEGMG